MPSKFEKVSVRMFCISGVLSDIYCMPDLKLLSFEELLNIHLHELGCKSVVFYSGAKEMFFALDEDGRRGFEYMRKEEKKTSPENQAANAVQKNPNISGSAPAAPTGIGRGIRSSRSEDKKSERRNYSVAAKDETAAAKMADKFMRSTAERKALVFTSLEDFVNNGKPEGRRSFFAYFEDWKSLPNENRNICIFISKSVNSANLQQIFSDRGNIALQSLFIKDMNSSGAEFNQNSSIIVGSPLGDEIGNLLEYLRIVGYTYIKRDSSNLDVSVTAKLDFAHTEKERLVRALSFFNRDAEFSELKSMKEALETYMQEQGEETVFITPEIAASIYSQNGKSFSDDNDPLEIIRNTKGWETAYNVINSFVVSHRGRKRDDTGVKSRDLYSGIERLEPDRASRAAHGKVPNFVLQGPPGVGKTEIANLIGRILQKEGILKSGHTVVGSRDKLIGQYVGSTAIQTAAMIEQAQEGVLLIDEVYNLAENNGDGSNTVNYSAEAINTLVAAMTNKNYRFCVIFSGYANRMDKVWDMNEGLFSRFGDSNIINIEGYKPELLQSIFEGHFSGRDEDGQVFRLSDEVKNDLPVFFSNLYAERDRENFGNARDMNVLSSSVKRAAGYRYIKEELTGDIQVIKEDFGTKTGLFEKKGLSTEDIYSKIYEYVGLDFLVDMFNDQLALKVEYEEKGLEYPGPSHMIWCGNPGTGKSTAAQLTVDLYHSLGILGGTKPIYVDASEIMSSYIGGGAEQIRKKIDEACQHNTVLVIEEAYQLINNPNGREIINAMLNRMEVDRSRFNVIFVIYTSLRDKFLSVNPGMESRVLTYEFKDYNGEQLMEIFLNMCAKTSDKVSAEAAERIRELLIKLYSSGASANGNARIVRKLLENMRQLRYRRITDELAVKYYGNADNISRGKISAGRSLGTIEIPENAYIFTSDDIPGDFFDKISKSYAASAIAQENGFIHT